MTDNINNPTHYKQASVQLEPIDVLRYAPFDLGNCMKYILRAGHKGDKMEDLAKARWYLEDAEDFEAFSGTKAHDEFFGRYGLLLTKFKRLMTVSDLRSLHWVIDALEKGNLE